MTHHHQYVPAHATNRTPILVCNGCGSQQRALAGSHNALIWALRLVEIDVDNLRRGRGL